MLAPRSPHAPAAVRASERLGAAWAAARQRHKLFDSPDRDCAQALVSRVFRPHRLEPHRGAGMSASMELLRAGFVSLSRLAYGTEVAILPGPLERFYLLQVPLSGSAEVRVGRDAICSDMQQASLVSPDADLAMRWSADNAQIIVRVEAQALQRCLAAWLGRDDGPVVHFDPALALDRHPALLDTLLCLIEVAGRIDGSDGGGGLGTAELPLAQLHQRLIVALLAHQPHDQRHWLDQAATPVTPRGVKRVEEYLVAHCHEAITPDRLAEVAGVGLRSLYLGFQRHRGAGPMALLRELRLQRAHDELLSAGPSVQVTDVALRWGFCHLGRFSQSYQRAFGESPRQTLQACRTA